jgi:hypothetical protein
VPKKISPRLNKILSPGFNAGKKEFTRLTDCQGKAGVVPIFLSAPDELT